MTAPGALAPALRAAWGLNRHSVVEVVTDRGTNVELHRLVQVCARAHARACACVRDGAAPAQALPLPFGWWCRRV